MTVTTNHLIKYLLESETPPIPENIDPIAASPLMLAFCADILHQYNVQKNLTAQTPRRIS